MIPSSLLPTLQILLTLASSNLVLSEPLPIFPNATVFSEVWGNPEAISNLKPAIAVQAFLGEGIGTSGISSETAVHVIVTISGTEPETAVPIPYASQPLTLALDSQKKVNCVIEQGNGGFEKYTLSRNFTTFKTNNMGRVSFSIPVTSSGGKWSIFPTLYARADFMPKDTWVAAHLSLELEHKLTKITALDLQRLNPALTNDTAGSAAYAIQHLAGLMQGSSPKQQATSKQRRSLGFEASFSHKPLVNQRLHFDTARDYLSTYTVYNPFQESVGTMEKRSFHPNRLDIFFNHVQPHQSSASFMDQNMTSLWMSSNLSRRDSLEHKPLVVDHQNGWTLAKQDKTKSIWAKFRQKSKNVLHFLLETVKSVWEAIIKILGTVGISILEIIKSFQRMFGWHDMMNSKKFLRLYYQLLSPLGPEGLKILRTQYRSGIYNMTVATHGIFDHVIEGLGGKDMTLKDIKARADEIRKDTVEQHPAIHGALPFMREHKNAHKMGNLSSSEAHSVLFASGTTNLFSDRYINNMAAMTIKNGSLVKELLSLSREAAHALRRAVGPELYEQIKPHMLQFDKDTAFFKKGLAQVLNLIRSIALLGETIAANVLDAILMVVPMYWGIALKIMNLELDIPFFNYWWGKRISQDKEAKLSIMDFLCLAGALYATPQYKIYNHGRPPFSDTDIAVLKTSKSPELLLYTWNRDPRTMSNDQKVKDHRLNIYDTIPRCMNIIVWLVMKVPYNMIMLTDPTATVASPPPSTHAIQAIGGVLELLGPISAYPINQLETNDPAELEKSMANPDSRFLQYWATWVLECFVRTTRPYMGKRMNEFPGTAIMNTLMMGVPITIYHIRINIDSGKRIPKGDKAQMAVQFCNWMEVALWYADLIWQFVSEVYAKVIPRYEAILIAAGRDMLQVGNQVLRANLLIGFDISGMLSSSYQGDSKVTSNATSPAATVSSPAQNLLHRIHGHQNPK